MARGCSFCRNYSFENAGGQCFLSLDLFFYMVRFFCYGFKNNCMKLFLLLVWMLGMTCNCFVKGEQTDPVKKAKQANEQKADRGIVDKSAADFLVAAADASMVDMQED